MSELRDIKGFLTLFTFEKKRDLEKYCREFTIYSSDFVAFILACEGNRLPFLHRIHYRDFVPEHLNPTDNDLAALSANPVGPLQPDAQKTMRKVFQIFRDRRQLVGHIFYVPGTFEWHFFQFDQRATLKIQLTTGRRGRTSISSTGFGPTMTQRLCGPISLQVR
jgi:hypothetical protein